MSMCQAEGKGVERHAWKAWIAEGMVEEYERRHREIWPEMTEMLDRAGIHNYSIWNTGNQLFAYFECSMDYEASLAIQLESETGRRWNESMKGILVTDDGTGQPVTLRQVFFHP